MPGRDRLGATWRFWTGVLRIAFRLGFRMRVVGVEHVPTTGAALLASNHVSSLDGMVLATVTAARRRRPTTFLIAAEYFRNPVLRAILSSGGQVPIRRGGPGGGGRAAGGGGAR
ncbi:MAG: lysophospholipid acyltransferase family protein, partial [Actinomycetota bacterium]